MAETKTFALVRWNRSGAKTDHENGIGERKKCKKQANKETAFFVRRTWHRRIGHCGSLVQEYPEAGYWLTTAAELTRRPHWSRGRFIGRLAVSISVKT
jgi:hypothetical protein